MGKPNYDEEHDDHTLHIGNQLELMIKESSLGMKDDASMLTSKETAQQKLVYITNLRKYLQNCGIELDKEEGPKDKKPPVKIRPLEKPSLINP